jgi:hypothetical protein
MAALVSGSRGLPDFRYLHYERNSGKPELRCHPRLVLGTKDVDVRPAQTSLRSLRKLDCVAGHDAENGG